MKFQFANVVIKKEDEENLVEDDIPVESTTDLEALGSTSSTKNINDDDEMRILGDIEQEKDALSTLLLLSTNDTNQQQTFCKNADNSKDKENQEEDRILNDDDDNGDSYDGLRTTQKDNEDEQDDDSHGGGDDISDDLNKNEFKQQGEEKTIEPSPSNKLFVGSKCFKFDQIIEVPQGGGVETIHQSLSRKVIHHESSPTKLTMMRMMGLRKKIKWSLRTMMTKSLYRSALFIRRKKRNLPFVVAPNQLQCLQIRRKRKQKNYDELNIRRKKKKMNKSRQRKRLQHWKRS